MGRQVSELVLHRMHLEARALHVHRPRGACARRRSVDRERGGGVGAADGGVLREREGGGAGVEDSVEGLQQQRRERGVGDVRFGGVEEEGGQGQAGADRVVGEDGGEAAREAADVPQQPLGRVPVQRTLIETGLNGL